MNVRTLVAFLLAGLVVLLIVAFCGVPVPSPPGTAPGAFRG